MLKKVHLLFLLLFIALTSSTSIYAYWDEQLQNNNMQTVAVGNFTNIFCINPNFGTVVVAQCFYNHYMQQNGESYDWKRDEYNNIINRQEINNLTVQDTIVYHQNIAFLVVANNYNMIDHGIPNINSPLSWALVPITINYNVGWSYTKNHIVQTLDGSFYMAKHHTSANPNTHREDWNKIEPVTDTAFPVLQNSALRDYRNPNLNLITRSYIYDSYNTYQINDTVLYNGFEWVAISQSKSVVPSPQNSWAWQRVE